MRKLIRHLMLVFFLPILISTPGYTADFLGNVKEAISNIELGKYDAAASALDKAVTLDDSDPLAHTALGVVYLHTSRLNDAEREFNQVLAATPDDWRAHYALAIINISRGKIPASEEHFAFVRKQSSARDEISALDRYLNFVGGKYVSGSSSSGSSIPLGKLVEAVDAAKTGKNDAASSLLTDVLRTPALLGFQENRSPLATFEPSRPISLPIGKLTWKPKAHKDAPSLSGVVTLRADAGRSGSPSFVNVYVDDVWIGATNNAPYEFQWNTANHPNGMHSVRIEAKDEYGHIVSKKNVWVKLENASRVKSETRFGPEVSELFDRLWNCTRVNESRTFVHYRLAKLYMESGDTDKAIEQLEYTVAYQPDYLDARKLLTKLRGRAWGFPEFERGGIGGKTIALTFDDGPNVRTPELLDTLAKLGVPATFFVVGFRAEQYPQVVKEIQSAGHEIQNHSYTHTRFPGMSADEVEGELSKNAAVIREITGNTSMFFRPPGGHTDEPTKQAASRQGFTAVYWTVNCSPYEGEKSSLLPDHVINNASDGGIVLMHNGEPGTISALPRIVSGLKSKGYKFVTLSEMSGGMSAKSLPNAPQALQAESKTFGFR